MVRWKKGVRLKPGVFKLPVRKIASGWYSDKYFLRTRDVLKKDRRRADVIMQVFARELAVVCGLDEAAAVIKLCADRSKNLKIRALFDGERVKPWETVMTIEGNYANFAHLETVYLGIISRRSSVATAVDEVVRAAHPKQVLFFPARFDHYSVQTGDGYAAFISGALGVSTDANAAWWGAKGIGTVPHGLIAAYNGDTVRACLAFVKHVPKSVNCVALVDFENDCVKTSLDVARVLEKRLWAVRLDTSGDLRDKSVKGRGPDSFGVCPELVRNVRRALDRNGFRWVKIVVSGGFNKERILNFRRRNVPFDMVGVGSAFLRKHIDFTADVVVVNRKPCAKVGRRYRPNPRLKFVA
ncbi:MAG: nicotinate phosphoribosyltransferase [Candidatus Omnitrophica bacterium]|nr:nicotinate phosphoribosyltransferase [Candidatus Omnitrophota bacterium]